jgi:hypothetical protein
MILIGYCFAAHTSASDGPVEPPVYSTTMLPGRSRPSASAASMADFAIRSFMLPVGFAPSSFTTMRAEPGGTIFLSCTSGVLPIAPRTLIAIVMIMLPD